MGLRADAYGSLRRLLLRHGHISPARDEVRMAEDEDLAQWFTHPLVQLTAQQELERSAIYSEQISHLESRILAIARTNDDYRLLQQIPGLGVILALTVLYEVGEISRFESVRTFSSYCRVVPGIAQSGNVSKRGRGSKQGNHYLKWALSQAAVHAVRYYPRVRKCFARHLQRHRGRGRKMIAYNIIAHKLAQAVFFVLRDRVEYREELLFGR